MNATLQLENNPCRSQSDKKRRTQGGRANHSGQKAEDTIFCIFKESGYHVSRQVYIGKSIYGSELKADFMIQGIDSFPNGLIIESKWQSASGSVDEKLPYVYQNIISGLYPCPVIIVLDGGGYRQGAENWIKSKVDRANFFAVFSFSELLDWVIRDL